MDLDPSEFRLQAHSSTLSNSRDGDENGTLSRGFDEEIGTVVHVCYYFTSFCSNRTCHLKQRQHEIFKSDSLEILRIFQVFLCSGKNC